MADDEPVSGDDGDHLSPRSSPPEQVPPAGLDAITEDIAAGADKHVDQSTAPEAEDIVAGDGNIVVDEAQGGDETSAVANADEFDNTAALADVNDGDDEASGALDVPEPHAGEPAPESREGKATDVAEADDSAANTNDNVLLEEGDAAAAPLSDQVPPPESEELSTELVEASEHEDVEAMVPEPAEAVVPEPVEANLALPAEAAEPVEPDPVEPDPVEPEPVEPEPVEAEPMESEPVETDDAVASDAAAADAPTDGQIGAPETPEAPEPATPLVEIVEAEPTESAAPLESQAPSDAADAVGAARARGRSRPPPPPPSRNNTQAVRASTVPNPVLEAAEAAAAARRRPGPPPPLPPPRRGPTPSAPVAASSSNASESDDGVVLRRPPRLPPPRRPPPPPPSVQAAQPTDDEDSTAADAAWVLERRVSAVGSFTTVASGRDSWASTTETPTSATALTPASLPSYPSRTSFLGDAAGRRPASTTVGAAGAGSDTESTASTVPPARPASMYLHAIATAATASQPMVTPSLPAPVRQAEWPLEVDEAGRRLAPHSFDNLHRIAVLEYAFLVPKPLMGMGRSFVREGYLTKVTSEGDVLRYVALFNDRLVYGRAVVPPPTDASWVPVPELTRFANLTVVSLDDTTVRESTLRPLGLEVRNAQHSLLLYASERADYVDWRTKLLHFARLAALARRAAPAPGASAAAVRAPSPAPSVSSSDSIASTKSGSGATQAWVPDKQAGICMLCHKRSFGYLVRKHHCRNCGRVVCSNCSQRQWLLPHIAPTPSRVCNVCYDELLNESVLRPVKASVEPAVLATGYTDSDDDEGTTLRVREMVQPLPATCTSPQTPGSPEPAPLRTAEEQAELHRPEAVQHRNVTIFDGAVLDVSTGDDEADAVVPNILPAGEIAS